jgi:hypothetical protein
MAVVELFGTPTSSAGAWYRSQKRSLSWSLACTMIVSLAVCGYAVTAEHPSYLYYAIGRVYHTLGMVNRAEAQYVRATDVDPYFSAARYHLILVTEHKTPRYQVARELDRFEYEANGYRWAKKARAQLDRLVDTNVMAELAAPSLTTDGANKVAEQRWFFTAEPRRVLFQHPPAEVVLPLHCDNPATFYFGIALNPEVWYMGKGDGVEFRITVRTGNAEKTVFSRFLNPVQRLADRTVYEYAVDLSGCSQDSELVLSTHPGPDGDLTYDWAGWVEPYLVTNSGSHGE